MFQGPANVTLDTKGRFGVPARYRQDVAEASGGRVICTVHPDRCVLIYRPEDFAKVRSDVARQKGGRDAERLIVGYATDVSLDAAGRLRVPPVLREYCDLQRQATLLALGRSFELWDAARWRERALEVSTSESMDAALSAVQL
ncbi:MAG: division/cell wall cluster transcriptional repressor MraZ [Gammaproteobacteria bacterium]|nr:division/cell wall cluster transcriptional repressor MraZ [Gammaproteobacteria bacterium]